MPQMQLAAAVEHGSQELVEAVAHMGEVQEVRQAPEPGDRGQQGQHHQGDRHHQWVFMEMTGFLGRATVLAVEGHEQQPEHVETGQAGGAEAQQPEHRVPTLPGLPEDLVLGEETGQRRKPGNGDGADQEGPVGDGQM